MGLSASFVADLQEALGRGHVITEPEQLRVYECDGLTGHRAIPIAGGVVVSLARMNRIL
jgi:hypothetical protein